MPTPTNSQIISALYVATFNRAPDKSGLTFWQGQFTTNSSAAVQQLAAGFASHPAFTQLYGGLDNLAFVQQIYINVLGQQGDAGGITFWNALLENGTLSRSQFLAAFVESALTADFPNPALTADENAAAQERQDYLTNKADVGLYFADTLGDASNLLPTTNPDILDGPNGLLADPAYQASQAILAGVTDNDSSVLAAETLINTASTQPDPAGYIIDHELSPPGETFTLTPNQDTVNPSSANAGDHVIGVVDGLPVAIGGSTYTNGDIINGNGNTIVELTVQDLTGAGAAAVATINNVKEIDITAASTGTINFSAVNWSSVGAVNLAKGTDGLSVFVDLLEDGTDLSIASGISGSLSADYVSGLEVDLFAGHASALSWINGDVDATVAASESATFTAFMPTGDVTVGDINATVGQNGYFGAFVSASQSGDISVGNVTVAAETSATVSVSVSNTDGGSVTVGDVSMLGGTYEYLGVFNFDATGDVLVGDVSMSVSASASLYLTVSNTGTTGESLGSLTVGNIDLALDHDSTGSVDILNYNRYTTDGLSLGALTVGDLAIDLGRDSSFDVSITQSASGTTGNVLASFGDVNIGNLSGTIGTNSFLSYELFVNNSLSGDIASVTIGNVDLALADGAVLSYYASVTADKGDITSFVMGDVTVNLGVDASVDSMSIDLNAFNGGNIDTVVIGDVSIIGTQAVTFAVSNDYNLGISATNGIVDSVTVGNFTNVTGKDAGFQYDATVSGNLGVNDVTFGDFDLTAHDAQSYTFDLNVSAFSGDVGTVNVGDISIAATGTQTAFFDIAVSASGDAGVLNVGNISVDTTKDAFISMSLSSTATLAGDINIAGLSINGTDTVGGGGYNGLFLSINTTGDVTLGDLNFDLTINNITGANTLPGLNLTNFIGGLVDSITGTVDYSGLVLNWTAAATDAGNGIVADLSGYTGNANVIGSAYNDEIDDNIGTNHLTGGDGADLFVFDTAQTNKTLATMDQVLDFTNTDGDLLDVGVTPNAGTYAEGSFADFAAFNAAANAANKEVFVGAVTGNDLVVAVDWNTDGNVDYMVQLVGINLNQVDLASFV